MYVVCVLQIKLNFLFWILLFTTISCEYFFHMVNLIGIYFFTTVSVLNAYTVYDNKFCVVFFPLIIFNDVSQLQIMNSGRESALTNFQYCTIIEKKSYTLQIHKQLHRWQKETFESNRKIDYFFYFLLFSHNNNNRQCINHFKCFMYDFTRRFIR